MTTATDWTDRAIMLRDAATMRERAAKDLLTEANAFRETAEACIREASRQNKTKNRDRTWAE